MLAVYAGAACLPIVGCCWLQNAHVCSLSLYRCASAFPFLVLAHSLKAGIERGDEPMHSAIYIYILFYELQLLYTYKCLSQKHSPSGIIELKDVRRVTDINGDGVFRVCRVIHTHTHTHTH